MINKLIIFLIRKKFGLKTNEHFKFSNQKKMGVYHFSDTSLIKVIGKTSYSSGVPLNWLLSEECKIIRL